MKEGRKKVRKETHTYTDVHTLRKQIITQEHPHNLKQVHKDDCCHGPDNGKILSQHLAKPRDAVQLISGTACSWISLSLLEDDSLGGKHH